MAKKKKPIIQNHHIKYKDRDGEDWIVPVFKGEHHVCTLIKIYTSKKISHGFLQHLQYIINTKSKEAIDLEKEE